MNLIKKCIAELIGTAVLTFTACGVAVIAGTSLIGSTAWWVSTSLAFGFVIVAMAYSIGNVSGCHINPAVSLGLALSKRMSWKDFFAYVGSQIVGAFIGTLLLGVCLRGQFEALGGNEIQAFLMDAKGNLDAWSYIDAFLVETLLTFIFVIAILGVTDEKHQKDNHGAGIVIGLTLALVHLLGLGFTGTSVNPARSIAPAIIQAIAGKTTSLTQIWIWILAPLAGAALAALAYSFLTKEKENKQAK